MKEKIFQVGRLKDQVSGFSIEWIENVPIFSQDYDLGDDPAPDLKIEHTDSKGRQLKPKEALLLILFIFVL